MKNNPLTIAEYKNKFPENKTLIFDENPKTILFTQLPIGSHPLENVSVDEIAKKEGFTWLEGLRGPSGFIENAQQRISTHSEPLYDPVNKNIFNYKKLKQALENQKKLALVPIDSEIGYGVFYVGDKPLPPLTPLTFYAGDVEELKIYGNDPYTAMGLDRNNEPQVSDETSCILASKTGNLSRFINGTEDIDEFECSIYMNPHQVAKPNAGMFSVSVGGLPLVVLMSTEPIKKGDQILYSYGRSYWATAYIEKGLTQKLFYKSGKPIPSYLYREKVLPFQLPVSLKTQFEHEYGYLQVSGIQNLLEQDDDTEVMYERGGSFTLKEVKSGLYKTLKDHQHPINGLIFTLATLNQKKEVQSTLLLEILRLSVDPSFKGYFSETNYQLDAYLEGSSDQIYKALKKMDGFGLFPHLIKRADRSALVIESINDPTIGQKIAKMLK